MNTRTLRILAIVTSALLAIYLLTTYSGQNSRNYPSFVDGLKSEVNRINAVTIQTGNDQYTLVKGDTTWSVTERDNFPADVARLRELLLALSDAMVIERKTSDPAKYAQIGVEDPTGSDDSSSTKITLTGDDIEYVIIIGNTAQGNFRYARLANESGSVLINRNPDLPDGMDGWLFTSVLDIPANRIASLRVEHADGEVLDIMKSVEDPRNFSVVNVPAGRELSFETVANGMAGALSKLTLEDVRRDAVNEEDVDQEDANKKIADTNPDTVTTFISADGLTIVASSFIVQDDAGDDETRWFSFVATATEAEADDSSAAPESNATEADAADQSANDKAPAMKSAQEQADDINTRLSGWRIRLPDYKANLFARRMDELLKSLPSEDADPE